MKLDGHAIATVTCEGKLTVWQLSETDNPVPIDLSLNLSQAKSQTKQCPNVLLSFSYDGRLLSTVIGAKLYLCSQRDSGDWLCTALTNFHPEVNPMSLAFSPKNDFLALGDSKGGIKVWGISKGGTDILYELPEPAHEKGVSALAFHPRGETLISGGGDKFLREWKLPNLEMLSQTKVHKKMVTSLAFGLRDINLPVVLSADADGQLAMCLRGIKDEQCFRIGRQTGSAINGFAVSEKFDQLVVAENDGLWNWDLRHDAIVNLAQRLLPEKKSKAPR
jgi:WD40 repeat protein